MTTPKVIVVDDRPQEADVIRLLLEECGYAAEFFDNFRAAYDAIVREKGNRLLVNFQLNHPRNNGAALLQRIAEQQIPIPTVVVDCSNGDRSVAATCAQMDFVQHIVPAEQINLYKAPIQRAFQIIDASTAVSRRHNALPRSAAGRPSVFIIHGHNAAALERTERVLNSLGVTPIVLKDLPVLGETLIDGIESYDTAEFAVAILTSDDEGRIRSRKRGERPNKLKARARQNVIFEAGYFRAALGRERVLFLHDTAVEIPSDLNGVRRISLQESDEQITIRIMKIFSKLAIIPT